MELKAGSFFYYFIFGCIGSALLHSDFPYLQRARASLVAVPRILTAVAFLVVEPGRWVQGFQWLIAIIPYSCIIAFVRTSKVILKSNDDSKYPCQVSNFN